MLTGCRDTPHPATVVSSYQAMANGRIRTKLNYTIPINNTPSKPDEEIDIKFNQYKLKLERAWRYRTKEHSISVGDYVKQTKPNKCSTPFKPRIYLVVWQDESMMDERLREMQVTLSW